MGNCGGFGWRRNQDLMAMRRCTFLCEAVSKDSTASTVPFPNDYSELLEQVSVDWATGSISK